MEIPEGFEKLDAAVYRKGDELLIVGRLEPEGPFMLGLQIASKPEEAPAAEDPGPPPPGFEWTGETRPPKKGEYFWSDIRGRVVCAIKDESGVNQFGEPTGGRRILRPVDVPEKPKRTALRLVKSDES